MDVLRNVGEIIYPQNEIEIFIPNNKLLIQKPVNDSNPLTGFIKEEPKYSFIQVPLLL